MGRTLILICIMGPYFSDRARKERWGSGSTMRLRFPMIGRDFGPDGKFEYLTMTEPEPESDKDEG